MSEPGDLQFNIDNILHPENYAFNRAKKERHAEALPKPPQPPPLPQEPVPPPNTKQAIAAGLQKANAAAQAINGAALPSPAPGAPPPTRRWANWSAAWPRRSVHFPQRR
jgi:hypothetical protein